VSEPERRHSWFVRPNGSVWPEGRPAKDGLPADEGWTISAHKFTHPDGITKGEAIRIATSSGYLPREFVGTIRDADILANRPPHTLAHTHGVDTEHEAATASQQRKAINRLRLLWAYAMQPYIRRTGRGMSTYHAWDMLRLQHDAMDLTEVRRRATDLLNEGLLERTGHKTVLPTGRSAHQLRITQAGRDVLAALREDS